MQAGRGHDENRQYDKKGKKGGRLSAQKSTSCLFFVADSLK